MFQIGEFAEDFVEVRRTYDAWTPAAFADNDASVKKVIPIKAATAPLTAFIRTFIRFAPLLLSFLCLLYICLDTPLKIFIYDPFSSTRPFSGGNAFTGIHLMHFPLFSSHLLNFPRIIC